MESQWLFLSIDELLYRFHLYIAEPLISFFSFSWLWGNQEVADSLQAADLGVEVQQGFFDRFFLEPIRLLIESLQAGQGGASDGGYFPPQEPSSFGEILRDALFGGSGGESILSIIFGSFLGWIVIGAIVGLLIRWYLKEEIHFMQKRKALLYDLENTGYKREVGDSKSQRWEQIVKQVHSDDVNQWKIAVLDADSLLDDVLYEQGYAGEGVATKLRDAKNDNYETLRYAQEAHGVRNRIAHDAGYALSQREAKMAIASYERFFNELYHL
ncbi:MAG: hypothetical protein ACKKL4_03200 [Patescibacteria group bacterium]